MSVITGEAVMETKTVTISQKRQFTIPIKFFELLGFEKDAECLVRGNELVIRPVKQITGGEFAEEILADLIKKGYQGDELLREFKKEQAKVKQAVNGMLTDANLVAKGELDYSSYDDVFGSED